MDGGRGGEGVRGWSDLTPATFSARHGGHGHGHGHGHSSSPGHLASHVALLDAGVYPTSSRSGGPGVHSSSSSHDKNNPGLSGLGRLGLALEVDPGPGRADPSRTSSRAGATRSSARRRCRATRSLTASSRTGCFAGCAPSGCS
ncbi:hypothetical protein FA13DRAFT_1281060 [Coprinellus micaceus]|uniref:Uncharacterized protein n=1 Tax=Coprinellus micaceus TaxID=71717 RepID=A0A4Y7SSR3_COPMI|nr:hypothetical protein FA13DRAFT_1281060 [Coprinellus micaceus]